MEDVTVFCPKCLIKGQNKPILKRGSFYFCEDLNCELFENQQSFDLLLEKCKNSINTANIKTNDDKTNKNYIDSKLCPICAKAGIKKTVVKRGNCYLCEDFTCFFISTQSINENDQFLIDINEFSHKNYTENAQNLTSETFYKPNFDINTLLNNNISCVVNWIKLPCNLKAHISIISALFIHLDILSEKNALLSTIKREYKICEAFWNNFQPDKVKLFSFNFISRLFPLINDIPKNQLIHKDLNDRLFLTLSENIKSIDNSKSMLIHYNIETSCLKCGFYSIKTVKDYFVSILSGYKRLEVSKNKITYKIDCLNCKKLSDISIWLTKIPQSVILKFSGGCDGGGVGVFAGEILTEEGEVLDLVGVVEADEKYPYMDSSQETIMSFESYKSQILSCERVTQRFRVHFRDKRGWYCFSHQNDILCSPNPSLEIENNKNICMLILGRVSDSEKYKEIISSEEYIEKLTTISETVDFFSEADYQNEKQGIKIPKNIEVINKRNSEKDQNKNKEKTDSEKYNKNLPSEEYFEKLAVVSENADFYSENEKQGLQIPENTEVINEINRETDDNKNKEKSKKITEEITNNKNRRKRNYETNKKNKKEFIKKMKFVDDWNFHEAGEEETFFKCSNIQTNPPIVDIDDDSYLTSQFSQCDDDRRRHQRNSLTSSGVSSLSSSVYRKHQSPHSIRTASHFSGSTSSINETQASFVSSSVNVVNKAFDIDKLIDIYKTRMMEKQNKNLSSASSLSEGSEIMEFY